MTTPARTAEADRVELVYKWAVAQIGVQTAAEAVSLWYQEVPPTKTGLTRSRWLGLAVRLILTRRARARDLAIAYYRLTRALRLDATIKLPTDKGTHVSLEKLRQEFETVLDQIAPPERPRTPSAGTAAGGQGNDPLGLNETPQSLSSTPPALNPEHDDDAVLLEEIMQLEAEIARQDREAEAEAQALLQQLGMENLQKKLAEIDAQIAEKEAERLRQEAMKEAAARQAAAAARITMNAARGLTYNLADTDARVIGWARYSTTGHPCGWCAMLISRQVLYKSKGTADGSRPGVPADQNKFHDNDYCIAVPIFDRRQIESDLFALNRELDQLWQDEIKGKFGGADAIAEFRRLMRSRKYQARAQAAA